MTKIKFYSFIQPSRQKQYQPLDLVNVSRPRKKFSEEEDPQKTDQFIRVRQEARTLLQRELDKRKANIDILMQEVIRLETVKSQATNPATQERLQNIIDDINEVIQNQQSMIQQPQGGPASGDPFFTRPEGPELPQIPQAPPRIEASPELPQLTYGLDDKDQAAFESISQKLSGDINRLDLQGFTLLKDYYLRSDDEFKKALENQIKTENGLLDFKYYIIALNHLTQKDLTQDEKNLLLKFIERFQSVLNLEGMKDIKDIVDSIEDIEDLEGLETEEEIIEQLPPRTQENIKKIKLRPRPPEVREELNKKAEEETKVIQPLQRPALIKRIMNSEVYKDLTADEKEKLIEFGSKRNEGDAAKVAAYVNSMEDFRLEAIKYYKTTLVRSIDASRQAGPSQPPVQQGEEEEIIVPKWQPYISPTPMLDDEKKSTLREFIELEKRSQFKPLYSKVYAYANSGGEDPNFSDETLEDLYDFKKKTYSELEAYYKATGVDLRDKAGIGIAVDYLLYNLDANIKEKEAQKPSSSQPPKTFQEELEKSLESSEQVMRDLLEEVPKPQKPQTPSKRPGDDKWNTNSKTKKFYETLIENRQFKNLNSNGKEKLLDTIQDLWYAIRDPAKKPDVSKVEKWYGSADDLYTIIQTTDQLDDDFYTFMMQTVFNKLRGLYDTLEKEAKREKREDFAAQMEEYKNDINKMIGEMNKSRGEKKSKGSGLFKKDSVNDLIMKVIDVLEGDLDIDMSIFNANEAVLLKSILNSGMTPKEQDKVESILKGLKGKLGGLFDKQYPLKQTKPYVKK